MIIDFYNRGGGSGGGVTSGEVETMIENKQNLYTATTLSDITSPKEGDVAVLISGNTETQYSYVNGEWVETGTGGEQFVELTLEQYQALTSYTEDTTYIITDAPSIDLNTLATTGQVATKADATSVTANTGNTIFPKWNEQGVITGEQAKAYNVTFSINGDSKFVYCVNQHTSPTLYGPTSAGSAGQVLQSNGSGAPVWSSFKMWFGTQTQYDAITTKDSSTIYFVKED